MRIFASMEKTELEILVENKVRRFIKKELKEIMRRRNDHVFLITYDISGSGRDAGEYENIYRAIETTISHDSCMVSESSYLVSTQMTVRNIYDKLRRIITRKDDRFFVSRISKNWRYYLPDNTDGNNTRRWLETHGSN